MAVRPVKTQISLGGCQGWSESLLGAHSFCWLCHVVAIMRLWHFSSSVNSILQTHMPSHLVGLRCLIFRRSLRLLLYFKCANSEGSGETARMRRLAWAFAGCICDKYHNIMSWLKHRKHVKIQTPEKIAVIILTVMILSFRTHVWVNSADLDQTSPRGTVS